MPSQKNNVDAILRNDLLSFVRKSFEALNPGTPYVPAWHIDAICNKLDEVANFQCKRLLVTVPPRNLKSTVVSVAFVAWLLGRDPTLKIVCVSYSEDLARKFSRDTRTIMETEWYKKLFPKTRLAKCSETELETTRGGGRFATSIGGTATGRGGNFLIIDDPIDTYDVYSEAMLKQVIRWYSGTAVTRLDDPKRSAMVILMQRVHEEDLAGYVLAKGSYDHLNLPAFAVEHECIALTRGRVHRRKPGDLLHPERQDQAYLEEMKASMTSLAFSAQFQQSPVPLEGNLFQSSWFQWFKEAPHLGTFELVIQSWDPAFKTGPSNDYSVCTTWGIRAGACYLLDRVRIRRDMPELVREVQRLAAQYHPNAVLIEDAGPGTALIQSLIDAACPIYILPLRPIRSKETRAQQAAVLVEAGMVHLPEDAPWLGDYLKELLAFPAGRFDDQVDSTTQFLNWWAQSRRPRGPAVSVYSIGFRGSGSSGGDNYYARNGIPCPF